MQSEQVSNRVFRVALTGGRRSVAPKEPLSTLLRKETEKDHFLLERGSSLRLLMSSGLTLEGYAKVLQSWSRCWVPLEAAFELSAPEAWGGALAPGLRNHLIANDLATLGVSSLPFVHQSLVPRLEGARWLGAAYVLKGAQLGGLVISNHLYRRLGVREQGASFFNARDAGDDSIANDWHQWRERLDNIDLSDADRLKAVEGGKQVFRYLQKYL